jgi:hypothetical protein
MGALLSETLCQRAYIERYAIIGINKPYGGVLRRFAANDGQAYGTCVPRRMV